MSICLYYLFHALFFILFFVLCIIYIGVINIGVMFIRNSAFSKLFLSYIIGYRSKFNTEAGFADNGSFWDILFNLIDYFKLIETNKIKVNPVNPLLSLSNSFNHSISLLYDNSSKTTCPTPNNNNYEYRCYDVSGEAIYQCIMKWFKCMNIEYEENKGRFFAHIWLVPPRKTIQSPIGAFNMHELEKLYVGWTQEITWQQGDFIKHTREIKCDDRKTIKNLQQCTNIIESINTNC